MKIVYYCQHVLGLGHFFRTLEIINALDAHRIWFINGGESLEVPLPAHARLVQLPPLMMDPHFAGLHSANGRRQAEDLARLKERRRGQLQNLVDAVQPDCLITELFPFGRKAFRFELDPLLQHMAHGPLAKCLTVCSLRDILVEKEDVTRHETRVVKTLNRYYDAVLMHADSRLARLEQTFSHFDALRIPVFYTGYVAPCPPANAHKRVRNRLRLHDGQPLILVSGGGGKVAGPLLKAATAAYEYLDPTLQPVMQVFTGPYLDQSIFDSLVSHPQAGLRIDRFSDDFLSFMAAADLSISMAGYNTCMNLLATNTPGLVWPFAQNREQGMRSRQLAREARILPLTDADLNPRRLAGLMAPWLTGSVPERARPDVDLNGARSTASWLEGELGRAL